MNYKFSDEDVEEVEIINYRHRAPWIILHIKDNATQISLTKADIDILNKMLWDSMENKAS